MKAIEAKDPTAMKSKQLDRSLDTLRAGIDNTRPAADRFHIQLSRMTTTAAKEILMRKEGMKKFKEYGLVMDQMIPAFLEKQMGGNTWKRDSSSSTGLTKTQFKALERCCWPQIQLRSSLLWRILERSEPPRCSLRFSTTVAAPPLPL